MELCVAPLVIGIAIMIAPEGTGARFVELSLPSFLSFVFIECVSFRGLASVLDR
jgi:hypothetical protein